MRDYPPESIFIKRGGSNEPEDPEKENLKEEQEDETETIDRKTTL